MDTTIGLYPWKVCNETFAWVRRATLGYIFVDHLARFATWDIGFARWVSLYHTTC